MNFNLKGAVTPSPKFWWLNEESRANLERGYLSKGETPQEAVKRVCKASADRLGMPELAEQFEELVSRGWMSLSSPIWANMGNNDRRGLPISCFNSAVYDSMDSIIESLSEVEQMTSLGGGTSKDFSRIRPRGSVIRGNGKSNGPMPFIRRVNTSMEAISQGSTRRGACAVYLDIAHPDINEFLEIKDIGHEIQSLFTGVSVKDDWMEAMIAGDRDKRDIWAKVLRSRQEKGIPYLFFHDNVNKGKPEIYKRLGNELTSSNLCVSGSTILLTREGEKVIKDVVNTYQDVWNGKEFSSALVKQTNTGQKLFEVTVKQTGKDTYYKDLSCTEYHKWYDVEGKELRTHSLKEGDTLEVFTTPSGEVITSTVYRIREMKGLHDTYCVNEPKEHKAMFNGILTGNCSEIALPSNETESFVCCLSSMNVALYDEWKGTDAVKLAIFFLDGVMEEFIHKVKNIPYMERPYAFAKRHRALGLGVLGWHTYLQKNMIPFGSMEAKFKNTEVFKMIEKDSKQASQDLAKILGPAPIFLEEGAEGLVQYRNTCTNALAPTTSSSAILGQVSAGIEPLSSNYYLAKLSKGNFQRRNPELVKLLEGKGKSQEEVWSSIMMKGGSVQHLDFLTEEEKDVFKTFKEINQVEILNQAVARQRYIDQAQSINVNIPAEVSVKDINRMYIDYWRGGGKTLYYQRSESVAKELVNSLVSCTSCES